MPRLLPEVSIQIGPAPASEIELRGFPLMIIILFYIEMVLLKLVFTIIGIVFI